jgi:hypothetical protein
MASRREVGMNEPQIDRVVPPVAAADFIEAQRTVTAAYEREPGEPSIDRTIGILVDHFGEDRIDLVPTIMLRTRALAHLREHAMMRPWLLSGPAGAAVVLDEAVLKVAARHPFTAIESRWGFEPDSFFSAVLAEVEPRGAA